MSNETISRSALVIDDEPEYLQWLAEYFETFGLRTQFATSLPDALRAIDSDHYRVVLVDLEVPAPGASAQLAKARDPVITKFPGIAAAIHALNKGYKASEVIVYSVHDDDAAGSELRKMDVPYVLKGRAEVLKGILRNLLNRPPRVRTTRKAPPVRPSKKPLSRRPLPRASYRKK